MTGPDDACLHEEIRFSSYRRWVLCNRCHRGATIIRIAEYVGDGELSRDRILAAARAVMDQWSPEYFRREPAPTP